MRNLIVAGAAGLVLALAASSAFSMPTTEQILNHGFGGAAEQVSVGAFAAQGDARFAPSPAVQAPRQNPNDIGPTWRNGVDNGLGLAR